MSTPNRKRAGKKIVARRRYLELRMRAVASAPVARSGSKRSPGATSAIAPRGALAARPKGKVEARQAVKDHMLSLIAHELSQPLCVIANYAAAVTALLSVPVRENIESALTGVRAIAREADRSAAIFRRLRGLLQGDVLIRETVDVCSLVEGVVEQVIGEVTTHRMSVRRGMRGKSLVANVDPLLISQVLRNLIFNSIDALSLSDRQDGTIGVSVEVLHEEQLEVRVSDTGVGLPRDGVERIFGLFVSGKPDGSGLGLTLSRHIVTAHGGALWAEPNPGRGATFTLRIPLRRLRGGDREKKVKLRDAASSRQGRESPVTGKRSGQERRRGRTRAQLDPATRGASTSGQLGEGLSHDASPPSSRMLPRGVRSLAGRHSAAIPTRE
jgi:signal transduction histidine kinase